MKIIIFVLSSILSSGGLVFAMQPDPSVEIKQIDWVAQWHTKCGDKEQPTIEEQRKAVYSSIEKILSTSKNAPGTIGDKVDELSLGAVLCVGADYATFRLYKFEAVKTEVTPKQFVVQKTDKEAHELYCMHKLNVFMPKRVMGGITDENF